MVVAEHGIHTSEIMVIAMLLLLISFDVYVPNISDK